MVFGGLLVLKLMPIEEPTLAMGQGASLHRLFQRVDVGGFQPQLTAIQIGGRKPGPLGVERFHEGLQLGMLAPGKFRAFALVSAFGGFDICVLIKARGQSPSQSGSGAVFVFFDRLALARLPPVAETSTDLTVRKAPVLFGWAEQGRAAARPAAGRRPDTGGRSGEIGRDPRAREEPDFSEEAGAPARHQSPCSGRRPDGRRIQGIETCQLG